MYIRKHTQLDVNIFDLSLMDVMEKKDLFDQVAEMHTESIDSLKDVKMQTRLVVPTIYDRGNIRGVKYATNTITNSLFYDILGVNKTINKDCFGNTNIINSSNKEQGVKKKRKVINEQVVSDDEAKVYIPEYKTSTFINKHHKNEIRKSNKIIKLNDFEEKAGLRNYTVMLHNISEKRAKFDPTNSLLRTVDYVLFINTTYSVSEMKIAFQQMDDLLRIGYNTVGYGSYFNIFNNYNKAKPCSVELYKKYGVKESRVWKNDIENVHDFLEQYSIHKIAYNSLFDENETLVEAASNVFIPVTFVIFLENASHLFKQTDNIINEEHVIRDPKFFINTCSVPPSVGYPDFIRKEQPCINKKTNKLKQQSKQFTNISMDEYSLKTTLTIIPRNFSTRLIKSKLKSIKQFEVNKDCYHFFTEEDTVRFKEKGKNHADNLFCIRFDGRMDMSYYTFAINNWLKNRFASSYYEDFMRIEDWISCGRFVEPRFKENLATSYDELLGRQSSIAYKFNSAYKTLISQEMFDYEKASLLFMYVIIKSGLTVYTLKRTDWHSDNISMFVTPLKNNGYLFSREIAEKYYSSDVEVLHVGSARKAYLMEALFRMVRTMSREQLFEEIESIISSCKVSMDKALKNFMSRQTLAKELYKLATEKPGREIRQSFDVIFSKQVKTIVVLNYNMYRLLNDSESLQIIPMLLGDIFMSDYLDQLLGQIRIFNSYMKVYVEISLSTDKIVSTEGLSTRFLTNIEYVKRVQENFLQWYSSRGSKVKFINTLLENNCEAKVKIDNLEEFTNFLISEFNKEYFSNTK